MSAWIKAEKTGEPGARTLAEKGETERRFGARGRGTLGTITLGSASGTGGGTGGSGTSKGSTGAGASGDTLGTMAGVLVGRGGGTARRRMSATFSNSLRMGGPKERGL